MPQNGLVTRRAGTLAPQHGQALHASRNRLPSVAAVYHLRVGEGVRRVIRTNAYAGGSRRNSSWR
jgi:hypothetical protein